MYTKSEFSIKDLEHISGVKAHTLRIWEKRYDLLQPNRSDTNIRSYDTANLLRLLNVIALYENGYKISKIAKMSEDEIKEVILNKFKSRDEEVIKVLNALKTTLFSFDENLFEEVYQELIKKESFKNVFYEFFIPFLEEIGRLWQLEAITPAHEHFMSALIKQKIVLNIAEIPYGNTDPSKETFVLYLPDNEIHDIGLLYLNYELRSKGYKVIYLGQTVPLDSLTSVVEQLGDVSFVSYFTMTPLAEQIKFYIKEFYQQLNNDKISLHLLGRQAQLFGNKNIKGFDNTFIYASLVEFINKV